MDKLKTYRVYFNNEDVTEVDAYCEGEAVDLAEQIAYESGYTTFELEKVEYMWDAEDIGGAT